MGFENGFHTLITTNDLKENYLEGFESEEQIENFILQPSKESCRKIFSVCNADNLEFADIDSVKSLTNKIFLKSEFSLKSQQLNEDMNNNSVTQVNYEADSHALKPPDELHKAVRSLLSSALKCETNDKNDIIGNSSHWCEICLVYDPNGQNKHMEYHITPTNHFLKSVLGYEEVIQKYDAYSNHQEQPLYILETHAKNLVHFNCVFEKGLILMKNRLILKQKRWLNLLLLEVLNFTSCIRMFKFFDIRNLPRFGDDGGFMKNRLLTTEEGDSTLCSYINAISEFVKLLSYVTAKSFYSFSQEFESMLTDQEMEVFQFLKRTERLSGILTIFIMGWRESLKPKREIEMQATEMLSADLWRQNSRVLSSPDLRILLMCFGSFMASYHGGNISKSGIQAILLLINDMLSSILTIMEIQLDFKIAFLNSLHLAFLPGGWFDQAIEQPYFDFAKSLSLPVVSVNKFLIFLEVFNWFKGYNLNLDAIYKKIHGVCFPDYSFEVFKMRRL